MKEGDYILLEHQIILMMQTFATALTAQLNITLQTEQVKKATKTTLNATKFLTRTSDNKTRGQNKMSISLDTGMNTYISVDNNTNSFNTKRNFLMATAYLKWVDTILLQEARVKLDQTPKVQGYHVFSEPEILQQIKGYMILFKNDIPCTKIEEPILYREGVETQAIKLFLSDTTWVCYDVYRRHAGVLDIYQLMSEATNRKVFIGENF